MKFLKKHHWKTKDGTIVKITEMDDKHLLNTFHYLLKSAAKTLSREIACGYSVLSSLNGEMAQDCCQNEIDSVENMTPFDVALEEYPAFEKMYDELIKRGLVK